MVHHETHHNNPPTTTTEASPPSPGQAADTFKQTFSSKQAFMQSNYFRFLRFGSIDGSMLVVSALFGLSIDSWLAAKIGARGYGPIIGAAIGNVISDGVAAIPEGSMASFGALTGSALPILPLGAFLIARAPLSNRVKFVTGAFSTAVLVGAFAAEKILEEEEKHKVEE